MKKSNKSPKLPTTLIFLLACAFSAPSWAESSTTKDDTPSVSKSKKVDRTGKPRKGKASYYGKEFHGRKMADGTPMNPEANTAASRTLPLGTKAKVTNLENGKSEVVEIRDRGPYVDGRIVDVTPKVAEKLDMKEDGVATVEVKPIEIPKEGVESSSGR